MTSDSDIDTQAGLREPIREPQDRDPRDASAHHTPWVHAYRAIKSVQSARAGARVAAAHDSQYKALQLTHQQTHLCRKCPLSSKVHCARHNESRTQ